MSLFSKMPPIKHATETFTLAEGPVTINYPTELSGPSLHDLKDYLDIFLRKAQRLNDDPHDPVQLEGAQKALEKFKEKYPP